MLYELVSGLCSVKGRYELLTCRANKNLSNENFSDGGQPVSVRLFGRGLGRGGHAPVPDGAAEDAEAERKRNDAYACERTARGVRYQVTARGVVRYGKKKISSALVSQSVHQLLYIFYKQYKKKDHPTFEFRDSIQVEQVLHL